MGATKTSGESSLTGLLEAARGGDSNAADEIYRRLYQDLRRLARAQLARARGLRTLDTTALVHEAYLRLAPNKDLRVENEGHFLNLAARAMRNVVVDTVRRRSSEKRGGGLRVSWQQGLDPALEQPLSAEDVLALDTALDKLAQDSPRLAHLVELRFFCGLSLEQIAPLLEVGERTLKRDWRRARAFLWSEVRGQGAGLE